MVEEKYGFRDYVQIKRVNVMNEFLHISGSDLHNGERTIRSLHSLCGAQVIVSFPETYILTYLLLMPQSVLTNTARDA